MKKKNRYVSLGIILVFFFLIVTSFVKGNGNKNYHSNDSETSTEGVNDPVAATQSNHISYHTKLKEIQKNRMANMNNIKKTGNASIDFFHGLIALERSTILITDNYLSYEGDQKIKELAGNIIASRKEQITKVENLTLKYEPENHNNEDKENAYLEDYRNLLENSQQNEENSKETNLDTLFASKIIEQNETAIEMAKSILEYTDYEEIRTLARNIISIKEQEINQIHELLPKNKA